LFLPLLSQQEQITPNHVPRLYPISVYLKEQASFRQLMPSTTRIIVMIEHPQLPFCEYIAV